jgi:SAM-dependent methyltransferase
MLLDRARATFTIDEQIVSALPNAPLDASTSQERLLAWQRAGRTTLMREDLLPRVVRDIERSWPAFTDQPPGLTGRSPDELAAAVEALGPWLVPIPIAPDLTTFDDRMKFAVASERLLFRRDLITGTVAHLLGDDLARTTVLDIGCQAGFFSLDLAARGAAQVDGVDLRPGNVAQARFLAEHFGVDRASFSVADADEWDPDQQWDVVLNLGVLYHVTRPLQFIRETFDRCRRLAVIDTVCHREPVSAYLMLGERDVDKADEGSAAWELHPTYRAVIDTIHAAGFTDVLEVVGRAEPPHEWYEAGQRRCFLAFKEPPAPARPRDR